MFTSRVLTEMEQDTRDSIRPRGEATVFPLSSLQKQLWFSAQVHPDSPVNNISFCYRLYGKLHIPALETAFTEVLRRHEVLRARFTNDKGIPRQSIAPLERVSLPCADLTRAPHESREREGLAMAVASFARPFDLASGPLLRASLFRLASDEHLLAVVVHHIAFDGWSLGILCQDLAAAYRAAANSAQDVSLSPLPIQYTDFAAWQQKWLESEYAANQSAYWSSQLAGAREPLQLPLDHPRPIRQSFRGAEIVREIPVSAVVSLTKAARHQNATLYMALYAAFRLLLARHTGQPDILVSTPVAGRSRPPVDRLIGCFTNTVTLRTAVDENLSFSRWLREVKIEILEALTNHELPFDRVLADLRPVRDPSRPALAQTWFSLQNTLRTELYLPALIATHISLGAKTSRFDLALDVYPVGGRLRCVFTYNSDLFLPATVERLAGHYERLVTGVAARPSATLAEIDMLTAAERRRIVEEWNETKTFVPRQACVHDLFKARAIETPGAVAIEFGRKRLTYRELDERSTGLAAHLRKHGVGPESLVGVCLDRSLEMPIAILGVLKAGGAYVPLDPAFPDDRLAFMLRDSGATALLAGAGLAGRFPQYSGALVTFEEGMAFPADSSHPQTPAAGPENLACVLYTPDPTGKPQGVMVEHRSLVNFLESMRRAPGITRHDTLLAVTSISLDIAALELYLPLISGAKVVIADRMTATDGRALARLIAQRRITVMQATPATWRLLLESGWAGSRKLRALCGGEALSRDLAETLLSRTAILWNMYGHTATAVCSLLASVEPGTGPVSIGRPIANTTVYILDSRGRPVPAGVPGRLHIGGAGVARGYRNLPEQTANAFFANPVPERSRERIYRTDDLARYRPDGQVEFLGRADGHVSPGETAEIELVLRRHEAVSDAVVLVRETPKAGEQPIAWIIPAAGDIQSAAEIRKYACNQLPAYMIPGTIQFVDQFPLTSSGAVNRLSACSPAGAAPAHFESVLLRIFEDLLGRSPIGVDDNFFDLGGHSLLAARLVARIETETGHNIPAGILFEAPTVRQLAGATYKASSPLIRLNRECDESREPLFCVQWLNARLTTFQKIAPLLRQDRPIYALQIRLGPDDADTIHSIEDVAALYLREVRQRRSHGPCHLAGSGLGGLVAFEMAQQLLADGDEAGLLLMIDAPMPGGIAFLRERNFEALKRWARETLRWFAGRREPGAARKYLPRAYPRKLTLFTSSDAPTRTDKDWRRAWHEVAPGGLDVHVLPGDHTAVEEEPNVQLLASHLQDCLDRAERQAGAGLIPAGFTNSAV